MPALLTRVTAMLRKLIPAGAIVVLLTGTVFAQVGSTGNTPGNMSMGIPTGGGGRHLSPEEQQREQEIESKYHDAVSKMPDKKASTDPWGNVRNAPSAAKHKSQP
jgi:hypothetical protein